MAKKKVASGPKLELKAILRPDYRMPKDYDELTKIYKKLAHDADRRLLRLEQASSQENFKVATRWAYARAMKDIEGWSGEGAKRFETKPPKTISGLRSKIEDIRTFLLSPTSTKSGIKEIEKKRAATLNQTLGTNYKWNEIGIFFDSSLYNKLTDKDHMGSETAVKVVARIRRQGKQIKEEIKKANEKDVRAPENMVDRLVSDALSKYGNEVKELLSK